ncbi:LolA-like protein [Tautonia sociabilis]|uniref:Outer membrane lipoprotein-sorting protein n=1 Tax=Tautonia sociabilis TaxID=2080755 RepID=A0A432MI86_9BACT|nr:hypothetical protein [Tautonia sociabilis]RUL87072.1 hypothetical protein TsocGM_14125 [Tautonia sociabilis]
MFLTPGRSPLRFLAPALAFGLLVPAASSSRAQAQDQDDLPSAEEILAKSIEATGGVEAYQALSSRKITGSIEFADQGLTGELTIMQQAPNKLKVILELPGIGTIIEGTDGSEVYEINPITGERLKEGAEKAATLREADFDADLNWKEHYAQAETTGVEQVNDTRCFVVEMTPKEGTIETRYYAADSGLLLRVKRTIESPMGAVPVESTFSDFREVDGVTMPFQSTDTVLGQTVKTAFAAIEHGVTFPEGTFDLPEPLRPTEDRPDDHRD